MADLLCQFQANAGATVAIQGFRDDKDKVVSQIEFLDNFQGSIRKSLCSPFLFKGEDLDHGRPHDDCKKNRQEEHNHWNGQFGRQCRSFFLRF